MEVTGAVFQLYSPPDNTSISMSIFKPFTVYTCKVAAFNRVGTGPFSSEITVQTPEYGKAHNMGKIDQTFIFDIVCVHKFPEFYVHELC